MCGKGQFKSRGRRRSADWGKGKDNKTKDERIRGNVFVTGCCVSEGAGCRWGRQERGKSDNLCATHAHRLQPVMLQVVTHLPLPAVESSLHHLPAPEPQTDSLISSLGQLV